MKKKKKVTVTDLELLQDLETSHYEYNSYINILRFEKDFL